MSSEMKLPALDNTMGVLYLSAVLAMALWGAAGVQVYYYFNNYAKDHWWMKVLVVVVYSADTASQGLITQICYKYLVTNYANPAYLLHMESTLLPIMLLTGILSLGVQMFFIVRIWRLSTKNIWVTGAVGILVAGQFISTCAFYGIGHNFTEFAQLLPKTDLMHVINSFSAAADASIAIALCFLLHRSRSGFRNTEAIINRLIFFTINTGLITGVCAVLTLVTNIAFPSTFIYMIFYILVARVYTNSLLATLNSRESFRRGMPDNSTSKGMQSIHVDRINMSHLDSKTMAGPHSLSIKVDTETTHDGLKELNGSGRRSESDIEAGYSARSDKDHAF